MRRTARSVCGSLPTTLAVQRVPSISVTSIDDAPVTTWLFVRMKPSGVKRKPEPPPRCSPRRPCCRTSMLTTEGVMRAAAEVTAEE